MPFNDDGKFAYDPQWQGPLSGRSFEKQTEDALNAIDIKTIVRTYGDQEIEGAKGFAEGPYAASAEVEEETIDLGNGTVFSKTIDADTTFVFDGVPEGKAAAFVLIATSPASHTVAWPSNVRWAGGEPPELTAGGIDVLNFLTPDGGLTWYGTASITEIPIPDDGDDTLNGGGGNDI